MFPPAFNGIKHVLWNYFNFPPFLQKILIFLWLEIKFPDFSLKNFFSWPTATPSERVKATDSPQTISYLYILCACRCQQQPLLLTTTKLTWEVYRTKRTNACKPSFPLWPEKTKEHAGHDMNGRTTLEQNKIARCVRSSLFCHLSRFSLQRVKRPWARRLLFWT